MKKILQGVHNVTDFGSKLMNDNKIIMEMFGLRADFQCLSL